MWLAALAFVLGLAAGLAVRSDEVERLQEDNQALWADLRGEN